MSGKDTMRQVLVRAAQEHGVPLLDSRWSFVEQCRRLITSKKYGDVGGRAALRGDAE